MKWEVTIYLSLILIVLTVGCGGPAKQAAAEEFLDITKSGFRYSSSDIIAAGSTRGLIASNDDGYNWFNVRGPHIRNVTDIEDSESGSIVSGDGHIVISVDNWKTSNDITDTESGFGYVYSVKMLPKTQTILSGAKRGLFKSEDRGWTWGEADTTKGRVYDIELSKDLVCYIATEKGVYKSEDATEWHDTGLQKPAFDVVLLNEPYRMYAACGSQHVWAFSETSWSKISSQGLPDSIAIHEVVTNHDGSVLFVHTNTAVYAYRVSELSWKLINGINTFNHILNVYVSPITYDVFLRAEIEGESFPVVYKWKPEDNYWEALNYGVTETSMLFRFETDPDDEGTYFVKVLNESPGVNPWDTHIWWTSSDGGKTWSVVAETFVASKFGWSYATDSSNPGDFYTYAVDPSNIDNVYRISNVTEFQKSTDRGQSWRPLKGKWEFEEEDFIDHYRYASSAKFIQVNSLHINPFNTSEFFYIVNIKNRDIPRIAHTTDAGWVWHVSSNPKFAGVSDVELSYSPTSAVLFLIEEKPRSKTVLLKSTDFGRNWKTIYSNVSGFAFAVSPYNPLIVYAYYSVNTASGIIKKTLDGGESWQACKGQVVPVIRYKKTWETVRRVPDYNLLASYPSIRISQKDSKTLYLTDLSGVGMFRSQDAGDTWYPLALRTLRGNDPNLVWEENPEKLKQWKPQSRVARQ